MNTWAETEKLQKENASLVAEIAALKMEVASLLKDLNWLKEQIGLARKDRFGSSSEQSKYDFVQVLLFNDTEYDAHEEDNAAPEVKTTVIKGHTRRTRLNTDKLPEDIPTETIEYTLQEDEQDCPKCGGGTHPIGKETVREEIKIIPAQVILVKHVRTTYGCRNCEINAETPSIIKPPMPEPVIKGSFASASAIAHIMVQKFVMGVPLYRQESEMLRQGIGLSRQTMSNWLLNATEDWLKPIYELLYERLLRQDSLMADETTLQVIKEPGRRAQQKSYLWVYRTGWGARYPTVVCEYQPGRHGKYPKAFLSGYKGYLQVDGYDGYNNISKDVIILGCFYHARSYFDDALKILPADKREETAAWRGKRYCDALFDIERMIAGMSANERYLWRMALAKPVLEEYHEWLLSFNNLGKSLFAKAVNYSLAQWEYLNNYLLDGRLEISNNKSERTVKMYVIDRKNFLFAYTPRGATASAIIFSIIQTAIENDLSPYEYLSHIFANAPNWKKAYGPGFAERLLPEAVPESLKAPIRKDKCHDISAQFYNDSILLP